MVQGQIKVQTQTDTQTQHTTHHPDSLTDIYIDWLGYERQADKDVFNI